MKDAANLWSDQRSGRHDHQPNENYRHVDRQPVEKL
jgi:hypothetical protein